MFNPEQPRTYDGHEKHSDNEKGKVVRSVRETTVEPVETESPEERSKKVDEIKASLGTEANEEVGHNERREIFEQFGRERGEILNNILTHEVTSNGIDLVPVVGGGKMLSEALYGKTLSGETLEGKERIIHAGVAAGSLLLDATALGAAAKTGVLAGRSIKLVEKAGSQLAAKGATKSSRIFQSTARFMEKHPKLVEKMEQTADTKIRELVHDIEDYRRS